VGRARTPAAATMLQPQPPSEGGGVSASGLRMHNIILQGNRRQQSNKRLAAAVQSSEDEHLVRKIAELSHSVSGGRRVAEDRRFTEHHAQNVDRLVLDDPEPTQQRPTMGIPSLKLPPITELFHGKQPGSQSSREHRARSELLPTYPDDAPPMTDRPVHRSPRMPAVSGISEEGRVPTDLRSVQSLCSVILKGMVVAADQDDFSAKACSVGAVVDITTAAIARFNEVKPRRFPADTEAARLRRSMQAATDLKALRRALQAHSSYPRVQLTLRLLGWSEQGLWTPGKRLMCLRWLSWVHSEPPNAPLGRYISRSSISNLLSFMRHRNLIDQTTEQAMLTVSLEPALRVQRRPGTMRGRSDAVNFDKLVLKWTEVWNSGEATVQKAGVSWDLTAQRVLVGQIANVALQK